MVVGVEQVFGVHVADHLLEHGSLQHLTQDWQDSYRPVVLWIKLASFPFIEWYNFGNLPLSLKFVGHDR